jgi:hypothetical protein
MILNVRCVHCDTMYHPTCTQREYKAWMGGALVQRAFPNMSADDRELLISGTCGVCWDDMFGGFDE